MHLKNKLQQSGFTLVEMAIVLIIVGLLLTALLVPLQAQRNVSFQLKTQSYLENAKLALLGFSQTHGRLPCPATNNGTAVFPDDTGTANPSGSGVCMNQVGFLPAATLGLRPTDDQGFALDAWNNRMRYAVTTANTNAFTTSNGINEIGVSTLTPDLRVCATSTAANCTANIHLIDNAAAVIFSLGATANQASGGADENQNLTALSSTTFVSHAVTGSAAANGEFDHIILWLSP